jgi:hypothetical protein
LEVGIARENPAAMLPGADGVLVQPAPHRTVADARDESALLNLPPDVSHALKKTFCKTLFSLRTPSAACGGWDAQKV